MSCCFKTYITYFKNKYSNQINDLEHELENTIHKETELIINAEKYLEDTVVNRKNNIYWYNYPIEYNTNDNYNNYY